MNEQELTSKFEDILKWETGNHNFDFLSHKNDDDIFPFTNFSKHQMKNALQSAYELGQKVAK